MFFPFWIETDREWEYCQRFPVMVLVLTLLCLGVHIAVTGQLAPAEQADLVYRFGVVRTDFRWYSVFTCAFLHGGWPHLIGNVYFLLIYGASLERLLGSCRFTILYGVGALVSMLLHLATLSPFHADVPAIGASGAISAVLGAFFVLLPTAKVRCLVFFFLRPLIIPVPAFILLGVWFLVQLYSSLEMGGGGLQVAFWAHVGGFAAGTVVGLLLYRTGVSKRLAMERTLAENLHTAWQAMLAGHGAHAEDAYERYLKSEARDYKGDEPLLAGAIAIVHAHTRSQAIMDLLRAFRRAQNKQDQASMLAAYLHLRRKASAADIPPAVHKDAGLAAIACGHLPTALQALEAALAGDLEARDVDTILERTQAVLTHKCDHPDAAAAMAGLRASALDVEG